MPQIQSASVHFFHGHESSALDEPPSSGDEPKALLYFRAKTFREAAGPAFAFLRSAERCPRCSRALAHLYDRLGSTLFRDDDPRTLIGAFDPEDRNSCTLQERIVPTTH
jgi:hypothetical protein